MHTKNTGSVNIFIHTVVPNLGKASNMYCIRMNKVELRNYFFPINDRTIYATEALTEFNKWKCVSVLLVQSLHSFVTEPSELFWHAKSCHPRYTTDSLSWTHVSVNVQS